MSTYRYDIDIFDIFGSYLTAVFTVWFLFFHFWLISVVTITFIKKCFKRKLLKIKFPTKSSMKACLLSTPEVEVESSKDGVVILSEVLFVNEQYFVI